jgi:ribulose-phosphate 3-epimerase
MVKLAPSILAADFSRLGELVALVEKAGADRVHIDVMDGHFVPNLSMGSVVVKGLRPVTRLPLEVHLMVEDPGKFLDGFLTAGADAILFHLEVVPQPLQLIARVKAAGKKVGLAFNPDLPVGRIQPYLAAIDVALCMTVFPGFGGQGFLPGGLDRIAELRAMIDAANPACDLEIDGGVDLTTAGPALAAGANVLVAGTAVFGHPGGPVAAVERFLALPTR